MIRFLLAPRWIALHLATVAAIAGTLVLGSWQMRAYAEQEERERVAAANLAADAPATPIDDVLSAAQALPVDAVSRPVTLTGSYDAEQTLLLPERSVNGTPGWYVVTPIVAADGAVTPVLRGWVSQPTADAVAPPGGEVSLRGSLQPLETDGDAQVDPSQPLADGQVAALTGVAVFRSYPYPPSAVRQAQVVLTDEQVAKFQRYLIYNHAAGIGEPCLDVEDEVRDPFHRGANARFLLEADAPGAGNAQ